MCVDESLHPFHVCLRPRIQGNQALRSDAHPVGDVVARDDLCDLGVIDWLAFDARNVGRGNPRPPQNVTHGEIHSTGLGASWQAGPRRAYWAAGRFHT